MAKGTQLEGKIATFALYVEGSTLLIGTAPNRGRGSKSISSYAFSSDEGKRIAKALIQAACVAAGEEQPTGELRLGDTIIELSTAKEVAQ